MYTTIIFDFFDVIHTDPYKAWLKKQGIKREGIYSDVIKPLDNGQIDIPTFHKRLHKISGKSISTVKHEYDNTVPLDEGIVKFIEDLKKNYRVGLLSNSPSAYLHDILDKHDLKKLFNVVAISGDTGISKPSPEAFQNILKKLGSKPTESIFIDDYDYNVRAATKLGITGIQYTNLPTLKRDLINLGVTIN